MGSGNSEMGLDRVKYLKLWTMISIYIMMEFCDNDKHCRKS